MNDKPIPSWVPPGMEPEYREWQRQLDDYIGQWSRAARKFVEEKKAQRKPGGKADNGPSKV